MDLAHEFERRYNEILVPCASSLQALIAGYLSEMPRIDRVSVRAKSPASFIAKSQKKKSGKLHYRDPLGQIQDQIGARVIVFYTTDVEPVGERILKYCRHIEVTTKEPESDAEFGYFGKHFVLALPPDCIPTGIQIDRAPRLFELQVRTLFQHAWSEAEHDLAYKPQEGLTTDQKRRFAFTAAQAWGADRIFGELVGELSQKGDAARR